MALSVQEIRIRRLLNTYGDSIFRLALSYLHNEADAQEIVQDTIIQLLRYDPDFPDSGKEKAWLMKTAANLSRNRIRFNQTHEADDLQEQLAAEEKTDLSYVWDAVRQLPQKQREVIHLFYQEGYSTKEIADILRMKEATVRTRLVRARKLLKEMLKEAW